MDSRASRQEEPESQSMLTLEELIDDETEKLLKDKTLIQLFQITKANAQLQNEITAELQKHADRFTTLLKLIQTEKKVRNADGQQGRIADHNYAEYVQRFADSYKSLCEQSPQIAASQAISEVVIKFISVIYKDKALADGLNFLVTQKVVTKNPDTGSYSKRTKKGEFVLLNVVPDTSLVQRVQETLSDAIAALEQKITVPQDLDRILRHYVAQHDHEVVIIGNKVIPRPRYLDSIVAAVNLLASMH